MTAARAPLIELREVWKTYRSGALAVEVLRGVSLLIRPGEFVAIMGASGSGKTTLMNLIGCLDRPTGGQYRLGGRDVGALDRDALALLRRDSFGFVFQQYNLLPNATAAENVELPAIYAGLPAVKRRSRALALLDTLGLADRAAHRPRELSGGQQQRVSIARALMNGGRVILADEPTGALDSQSGREVLALLRELNAQGHTIVLITHDPAVAGEAGRRVTIADGVIVADDGADAAGMEEDESGAADAYADAARPVAAAYGLRDAVKMAWRSLRANLFRTILTLLGIIIGVGSVVAMLALGTGAKDAVLSRIEAMGSNLLVVRPGAANLHGAGGAVATLTPADAKAIAALPGVVAAVPEIDGAVTVRYRGADDQTEATATTADYPVARDWPTDRGIFFLDEDVDRYAPVTVLGRTVAEGLFADGADPIGAYVLVNNVPLQVIGVMAEKGATSWGRDRDDVIFVPLTTGSLRLLGQRHLRSITAQVDDSERMDAVQAEIEQLLLARHRARDFRIRNMASIIETVEQTQNTLTMLLGSIAAISLLVGGIGVMNIMLVSVTERTREIGIRMATGARAANILLQFVTEAVVVCALGGLAGVLGGLVAAWTFDHFGMPAIVSLPPVLLAFASAFLTGLLFGYMPARKAARLNPVTALGAE